MLTARQHRQQQALDRFEAFINFDTSCFVHEDGPHNDQSNSLLSMNIYDGIGYVLSHNRLDTLDSIAMLLAYYRGQQQAPCLSWIC